MHVASNLAVRRRLQVWMGPKISALMQPWRDAGKQKTDLDNLGSPHVRPLDFDNCPIRVAYGTWESATQRLDSFGPHAALPPCATLSTDIRPVTSTFNQYRKLFPIRKATHHGLILRHFEMSPKTPTPELFQSNCRKAL